MIPGEDNAQAADGARRNLHTQSPVAGDVWVDFERSLVITGRAAAEPLRSRPCIVAPSSLSVRGRCLPARSRQAGAAGAATVPTRQRGRGDAGAALRQPDRVVQPHDL